MAGIIQGKITKLKESGGVNVKATVMDTSSMVTMDVAIPERLQTLTYLDINTGVCCAVFDDNTALMLSRLDGKYS